MPGRSAFKAGCSESLCQGLVPDSFVIAPFDPAKGGCVSIPLERVATLDEIDGLLGQCAGDYGDTTFPFPSTSTTAAEHTAETETIISEIRSGRLEKCVLARVITGQGHVPVSALLRRLSADYPDAFVFMFHTRRSGTWIGATPEVLLETVRGHWRSMALAGTRKTGDTRLWSEKNVHEHEVVRDYLSNVLNGMAENVRLKGAKILVAGPVEHLMSRITFDIPEGTDIERILQTLSPTPALSGFPKREAIELISRTEKFERGYYGGYCGPYLENGTMQLYVNLRSMRWEPERYCLFAGGGIMGDSDPAEEWEETERKAETLLGDIGACLAASEGDA